MNAEQQAKRLRSRILDERDQDFLGWPLFAALRGGDPATIRAGAPTVPGDTCPMIDPLSVLLDAISSDLAVIREGLARSKSSIAREAAEELLDTDANLASARLKLEDIREANLQLRRSSYYWRRAFDIVNPR